MYFIIMTHTIEAFSHLLIILTNQNNNNNISCDKCHIIEAFLFALVQETTMISWILLLLFALGMALKLFILDLNNPLVLKFATITLEFLVLGFSW
jgi:hypothetical protein